jgi:predicted nucleic acid-binding protein
MGGAVTTEPEAVVVDASVLAAIVFGEDRADEGILLLGGKRLVAPALPWYEMSEVTRVKCRNSPGETGATIEQFRSARGLPIFLHQPEWSDLPVIALEHGLTAYDAAYLSLCLSFGIPLATFDRRLETAARKIAGGSDTETA